MFLHVIHVKIQEDRICAPPGSWSGSTKFIVKKTWKSRSHTRILVSGSIVASTFRTGIYSTEAKPTSPDRISQVSGKSHDCDMRNVTNHVIQHWCVIGVCTRRVRFSRRYARTLSRTHANFHVRREIKEAEEIWQNRNKSSRFKERQNVGGRHYILEQSPWSQLNLPNKIGWLSTKMQSRLVTTAGCIANWAENALNLYEKLITAERVLLGLQVPDNNTTRINLK